MGWRISKDIERPGFNQIMERGLQMLSFFPVQICALKFTILGQIGLRMRKENNISMIMTTPMRCTHFTQIHVHSYSIYPDALKTFSR